MLIDAIIYVILNMQAIIYRLQFTYHCIKDEIIPAFFHVVILSFCGTLHFGQFLTQCMMQLFL